MCIRTHHIMMPLHIHKPHIFIPLASEMYVLAGYSSSEGNWVMELGISDTILFI